MAPLFLISTLAVLTAILVPPLFSLLGIRRQP